MSLGRLLTAAAVLGGGYLAVTHLARTPTRRGRPNGNGPSRDPSCLDGVYLMPGPWSPEMVTHFQTAGIDMTPSPNITADAQLMAFDTAMMLIPQVQGDDQDPARDQVIQGALEVISPDCDWSERLMPYPFSPQSRFHQVWEGVGRVHDLARAVLVAQGDL